MPETPHDDATPQGGWQIPDDSAAQQTGAGKLLSGWRVPALESGFSEAPDAPGAWHRPRAQETTLTPGDETIIIAPLEDVKDIPKAEAVPEADLPDLLTPEQVLAAMMPPADDDTEPEVTPPAIVSPEDALASLALMSAEEDEDAAQESTGLRTEMLALGVLAESEPKPLETDTTPDAATDAEDPGAVARRRLAELQAGGTSEPVQQAAIEPAPAGQMLSSEDMRRERLAQLFAAKASEIQILRDQFRTGIIGEPQFEVELQNRMVQDDDRVWWRMGLHDPLWYRWDDSSGQWTEALPPAPTERVNYDPLNAPLSYIQDTGPREASGAATVQLHQLELSPLPNQVPQTDMGQTLVGGAAYRDALDPSSQPTVSGATVRSASIGYGSDPSVGIASPIDESIAPDVDMPLRTDLAETADEIQRGYTARLLTVLLAVVLGIGALVVVGGLLLANSFYDSVINRYESQIAALSSYKPEFQTVVISDITGGDLARLASAGDRIEVELNAINPYLIHAVISTRNPTFYTDPGWDTSSTIGAFLGSFGGPTQESPKTITQLVAQQLVISQGQTASQGTDLIVVAGELSRRYSKDFILRLFLNEFAFGNNTFGAEAAARFYFDKAAADLNLPEAALLAAMMENPGGVDPVSNRGTIKPAIENVVARMIMLGCLDIPGRGQTCVEPEVLNTGRYVRQKADVELDTYAPRDITTNYPHFVNIVRQQLEAVYGNEMYQRGFQVRTTFVPVAQNELQRLLNVRLRELAGTGITTGAAIWIDPRTGAVRAYVGSPDYNDAAIQGSRDYIRDYRYPGGAIVPLVYAAALEGIDKNGNGTLDFSEYLTAASVMWDVAVQYPATPSSPPFQPQNVNGRFFGAVPLREALQNQYAAAAVRAYEFVGEAIFRDVASRLGIQFADQTVYTLATAVGESPVRLIDLTSAYATIANGGTLYRPYMITEIKDSAGNPVELREPIRVPEQPAISAQTSYILQNILSDDLARNPALTPRDSALRLSSLASQNMLGAVASQNQARTDFWTIGFTHNHAVGVWLGTPDSSQTVANQTGLTAAAPLWNRLMNTVIIGMGASDQPRAFIDPGNLIVQPVCPLTGTVAVQGTQCATGLRQEVFAQTRQPPPAELGPVAQATVNTWTNLRFNSQYCGDQRDAVQRAFLNTTDPFIVAWLRDTNEGRTYAQRVGLGADASGMPTAECDVNTQMPTVELTSPANNAQVQGEIQILGQVATTANFNRYDLEIAPANTTSFQRLPGFPSQQPQPNPNSQLGVLDTRTIPNGTYTLRLSAYSNEGGSIFRTVTFSINNPTPTATPAPTLQPSPFPTFDTGGGAGGFATLPFDPITPGFGPSPTPDPF